MATFTLSQLKNNVPPATTGRIVSISDIQRDEQLKQDISGNRFEKEKPTTFLGKARDVVTNVIGGGKLAEGAGMALASPFVNKTLEESQKGLQQSRETLIAKIKENKSIGKDTSRLEKALKDSQATMASLADASSDFAEALPTTKEVIGSSVRLATTLGAGAIARGVSKMFALGKSTSFLTGAVKGLGAGATSGATIGALQGAGIGAEQDKNLSGIATDALLGMAGGVVVGGVIGAATGGIGGALRGQAIKKEEFAKKLVQEPMTKKFKAEAIRQGRIKDPTFFDKAEIRASKRDELLAKSVQDVVKPKATIGQNIDAVRLKIDEVDDGVRTYITKNKVPFNTNQLRSQLESGKADLELIFASDTNAERTYNAVSQAFIKNVAQKDTLGLFEARQDFDQIPAIQKLLQSDKLGENARKEIVLAVRRSANEYIASLLPSGNPYKPAMMQQSYALEALGNMSEKFASVIGKNGLQLLTEKYPIMKWLVGGIAAGMVGAAGIGVGSSIIGSTE